MLNKSSVFVLIALAACVCAKPQIVNDKENVNIINLINDIDAEKSLYLFGGLSVEKVNGARGGRSFASDVADVQERVQDYLESHELKFNVPEDSVDGKLSLVSGNECPSNSWSDKRIRDDNILSVQTSPVLTISFAFQTVLQPSRRQLNCRIMIWIVLGGEHIIKWIFAIM